MHGQRGYAEPGDWDDSVPPETRLPSQFFDEPARRYAVQGERRLLLAILDDAIHLYRAPTGARNRRRIREATQWIESRDRGWVFSFERICEALDLDSDYLRCHLSTKGEGRLLGT